MFNQSWLAMASPRVRDGDAGGAQQALALSVTRLQHLRHRRDVDAVAEVGLGVHQRLVDGRVERLAGLAEPLQAVPPEHPLQLVRDRGERAGLQVPVLAGQVDVVQHRKQRLEDAAHGLVACDVAVALDPLAVVDVLGLQPLQVGQPLRRQPRIPALAARAVSPSVPIRCRWA